ncbi:MAG: hypothetical protein M3Q19_07155 [Pseudomonadota bacterium]|nr:hypothetical protein [Pseudomonadota bacterium]
MRQAAVNFINDWIAIELLVKAPSGENDAKVRAKLIADAEAAGLDDDEAKACLADPDVAKVVAKHQGS